jgi:phosphoadenosine phosphosulfate reductase
MTSHGRSLPSLGDDAPTIIARALDHYGDGLHFACGFLLEDVVLLHMATQTGARPRAFFVDTGRHFEETYQAADDVQQALGLEVQWVFPERRDLSMLMTRDGATSITSDPTLRRRCCDVRRIRPLRRALDGAGAWVVGARRAQCAARAQLPVITLGSNTHWLPRIAPLAGWSLKQIVAYAQQHHLPIHSLSRRGYTSIGCSPCTRNVTSKEPERAGRWPFESQAEREQGDHMSGIWGAP